MKDNIVRIYGIGENPTHSLAAEELKRYIQIIDKNSRVFIEFKNEYEPSLKGIWIGLFDYFFSKPPILVENKNLDDAFYINITAAAGIIAASNSRALLMAVYKYLQSAGCRFIRPGSQGEYIPNLPIGSIEVNIKEKASYRFRGICIEGSVSYENVYDVIEWCPKVGFNSYFIQFKDAYTFFEKWYKREYNPLKKGREFTLEESKILTAELKKEIKRRGILYHGVGHGWTCEPFGISALPLEQKIFDVPDNIKRYLAELDGKREFFKGIPVNTNLCYSNKEVRNIIINFIVDYLDKEKNIDYLHLWLADGMNNHCECEECKKLLPSDYYVMLLNELDEALKNKGINTKIVFLIYVDLLWKPIKEKIKNSDRFIMMFAPITREFKDSFKAGEDSIELNPYNRNKLEYPKSIKENLGFLKTWKEYFKGDSFDFDYHLVWEHYYDPGYYRIAEIMYKDVVNLKDIGLNGMISCQMQRAFLPTGFVNYTMAKVLWNRKITFEEICDEYYAAAFGKNAETIKNYLKELSQIFDSDYARGEKGEIDKIAASRFKQAIDLIHLNMRFIDKISDSDVCRNLSYFYLKIHGKIAEYYCSMLLYRAEGNKDKKLEQWNRLKEFLFQEEDYIQRVFDVNQFIATLNGALKLDED